jgi:D-alanine-D-alanine ligase
MGRLSWPASGVVGTNMRMNPARIGVLMGGSSSEREVSLKSGQAVLRALEDAGRDAVAVVLGDGIDAIRAIEAAKIDSAFLALHGKLGEDGCVQGLLEMLRIPYTGSSVMSSALAMDKLKAKEMFRLHNVPTPPYYTVEARDSDTKLQDLHGSFGFPVIVKPRREGSSIGVAKASNFIELSNAIADALTYDDAVIVERFITAHEVHVGLLNGRVLGAVEVVPRSGIYDYASKYTPGATEYFCPARLAATRYRGVLNLGERAAAWTCSSPKARTSTSSR